MTTENNELVVIEEQTALQVLSSQDGVQKLIKDVRDRVMSLDGGDLNTKSGRAKIRSNAFKATKAKTQINEKYIKPLIEQITDKIQPDLDKIQALKDSKKILDSGLDQIRKDVNEEVQAIEDKIKQEEEKKAAEEEAARIAAEIEQAHEVAILMNEKFDRDMAERKAEEERQRIEAERIAEEQRKAREEQIRLQAIEEEKRRAQEERERIERERIAEKERADRLERERIEAEDRQKARERADYYGSIIRHIENCGIGFIGGQPQSFAVLFRELEEKVVIDESFGEFMQPALDAKIAAVEKLKAAQQRLIDEAEAAKRAEKEAAERARQAEIERQRQEQIRLEREAADREADIANKKRVNNAIKDAFVAGGMDEANAVLATKLLAAKKIPNASVSY